MQRITRYLVLVKGIVDNTEPSDPTWSIMNSTLEQLTALADHLTQAAQMREAQNRVIDIQGRLEGGKLDLITTTRYHIRDGPLKKKYNKTSFHRAEWQDYWFFMFNDGLLYTTVPNPSTGKCKPKFLLPFVSMRVVDIPDSTSLGQKYLFELSGSTKTVLLQAPSQKDKEDWIEALRDFVDSEKRKY